METIGDILRQQREQKQLTLENVHESTRITLSNLIALEENRFEEFPNKVYARAFLRDYANFLGLDSASLLKRYEEERNATTEPETLSTPTLVKGNRLKVAAIVIAAVVVLAGLCLAAYMGWNPPHKHASSRPPAEVTADNRSELPKSAAPTANPAEQAESIATKPAPHYDKIVLQVSALVDDWVLIEVDGKKVFGATIPKGATKTWTARQKIFIKAGMAGGVQLKLNGKTLPPLGNLREIGKKTFTIHDVAAP
jgi:cytoskeletal protein RodZ